MGIGVGVGVSGVIFIVEESNVFSVSELHASKEIVKNNIANNIFMIKL